MSNKTIDITHGDLELPLATEKGGVLTSRGFLTGTSGRGKSNTVGIICEQILDQGYPLMIIDTEGEYYSLKENYQILDCGASEECDLQVTVDHAEKLAELALEKNIPIVLDVSEFLEDEEANELIKETAKHLFYKADNKPFPIVLEEAHNYIPQKGSTQATKILKKIAKQGRKRGLGLIAVSQRPAEVDKGVITQSDWRVWHGFEWDNDLKVAKDVLGSIPITEENADLITEIMDDGNEYEPDESIDSEHLLKSFSPGEAVIECGFIDNSKQVIRIRKKTTFDAGATPTLDNQKQPELKSVDADLLSELEEVSKQKERERNRIEELEEKLEEKNEEIAELEDEIEATKRNTKNVDRLADRIAEIASGSEEGKEALDEIREEKEQKIRELERKLDNKKEKIEELEEDISERDDRIEELEEYEEYKQMADELENKKEVVSEAIERIGEAFDIETGSGEELKQKLKKERKRVSELEEKLESAGSEEQVFFEDEMEFIEDEKVQKFIDDAVQNTSLKEEHFWDVITYIGREKSATTNELSPFVDVGKKNISKILRKLEDYRVLTHEKEGKQKRYSFNIDNMRELKDLENRKKELREQRQEIRPNA